MQETRAVWNNRGEKAEKGGERVNNWWKRWTALLLCCYLAPLGLERCAPAAVPAGGAAVPKLVALTFDDGPRRSTTTALLDGLAQRGAKATFFLIGERLAGNEALVRRMDDEGHQIGIHSTTHRALTGLDESRFRAEVDDTRTRLKEILGHNDFLLRPPYGFVDGGVKARAGCPIILWSVDTEDWKVMDVCREVETAVENARDGDIILFHDIYAESVEAALTVVDKLRAQGFYCVTVEELFRAKGIGMTAGAVYRRAAD